MVRLYEYQGKQLLQTANISVPRGEVASTPEEARGAAERIGKPVTIKAQVWATGRFKAGGIRFANDPNESEKLASELIGAEIKGTKVRKLLVEERLEIEKEFYAGVIVNASREIRGPVVIFSTEGGVDIDQVTREFPERVVTLCVNYLKGVDSNDADQLVLKAGAPARLLKPLSATIRGLYDVFVRYEARSVEINPLVLTKDEKLFAADCRIAVDDSAIFRHPELGIKVAREFPKEPTALEMVAWTIEEGDYRGNAFFSQMVDKIEGPGYVGYHGIGGGGAILGVDALNRKGLKTANYSDSSGDPTASKVYRLAKTILAIPGTEGYLLGGFIVANQEQWHHAHALVKAFREELADKPGYPVVLLLCGNKEKESHAILKEGLRDLPIRCEIYGSEYVYNPDFIAERMRSLVDDYRKNRGIV